MVSDLTVALGSRDALHDPLERVARDASDLAAQACHALGVAIWLDAFGLVPGEGGDEEVHARLRTFLEQRHADGQTLQNGGIEHQVLRNGQDITIAMLPLIHAESRLGVMAVAVGTQTWRSTKVFESCAHVAGLVAMSIAQGVSRHQLEVDLAEANRREKRLTRMAEIDRLTGVENKVSFNAKCQARLTNDARPAALLALDLDDFKSVNDVYGHLFGDAFLKTVADALRAALPPSSIIGRTGGDEFCVLLDIPEAKRGYLRTTISNLRLAIRRNVASLGKTDLGGLSIGVSLFPNQASGFETLLSFADSALYASKRTERNATTIYSSRLEGVLAPSGLSDSGGQARFDNVTAHFQPIFDLGTGQTAGVEILARWQDDDGEVRKPESFAWMFRDHRLASKLTFHVIEAAFAALSAEDLLSSEDVPKFWINVMDQNLLNPDFIFDLQTILTRFGVDWSRIVIEINEDSVLGARDGLVFSSLQEIRQRGGRIALDDFGGGQSGLSHVCQWPVDIIKIDRSLVQRLSDDHGASVVVEALVMVARKLNQQVVAEGIEMSKQAAQARALGCDMGQGFALAEPMSAQSLAAHKRRLY